MAKSDFQAPGNVGKSDFCPNLEHSCLNSDSSAHTQHPGWKWLCSALSESCRISSPKPVCNALLLIIIIFIIILSLYWPFPSSTFLRVQIEACEMFNLLPKQNPSVLSPSSPSPSFTPKPSVCHLLALPVPLPPPSHLLGAFQLLFAAQALLSISQLLAYVTILITQPGIRMSWAQGAFSDRGGLEGFGDVVYGLVMDGVPEECNWFGREGIADA